MMKCNISRKCSSGGGSGSGRSGGGRDDYCLESYMEIGNYGATGEIKLRLLAASASR